MTESPKPANVADWQLERFRLGELPAEEIAEIRQALGEDEALRLRLEALERDSSAILADMPSRVIGASVRARLEAESRAKATARFGLRWQTASVAAAGIALAAVGLTAWYQARPVAPVTVTAKLEPTRIKGIAPRLHVFRQVEAGAEPLEPGSLAQENDVIQLAYQASGHPFGAIVSVDGRGVATRHLPSSGSTSAELSPGGPIRLSAAYRLDDAPAYEVFYFVTADAPFEIGPVEAEALAAAKRDPAGRLSLDASFEQHSIMLRKVGSR